MDEIKIDYDGVYPCLCSGQLFVTIHNKVWDFGNRVLDSGGYVWFDEEWGDHIESGPWSVDKWPDGFPNDLKQAVLGAINAQVQHGCCGGCI